MTAVTPERGEDVIEMRFSVGQTVFVSDDQDCCRDRSYQDELGVIISACPEDGDYLVEIDGGHQWHFRDSELSDYTRPAPSPATDHDRPVTWTAQSILDSLRAGDIPEGGFWPDHDERHPLALYTAPPATDEVVAVLRPFAEAADSYDDEREEWPLFEVHDILVGHLRAARDLLAKLEVGK